MTAVELKQDVQFVEVVEHVLQGDAHATQLVPWRTYCVFPC